MRAVSGVSGRRHLPYENSMKSWSVRITHILKYPSYFGTQVYGDFRIISPENEQVFAFTRTFGKNTALVLLNFRESNATFPLDEVKHLDGLKFVLGNYPSSGEDLASDSVVLKGYEGKVYLD